VGQLDSWDTAVVLSREGSNRNKVREAHKKLMIANHPDAGGSPFVASKVNLTAPHCQGNRGWQLTWPSAGERGEGFYPKWQNAVIFRRAIKQ